MPIKVDKFDKALDQLRVKVLIQKPNGKKYASREGYILKKNIDFFITSINSALKCFSKP